MDIEQDIAEVDRTEELRMYRVFQNLLKIQKVEVLKRKPKEPSVLINRDDQGLVENIVSKMGFKFTGSQSQMTFYENSKLRFVFIRGKNSTEIAIYTRLE